MIAAVIENAYAALAFEAGSEPDWAAFDATFDPGAVLALRVFPTDPEVSVLDLRSYRAAQLQHGLGEEGYSETPGARDVDEVGDVALVRQQFTMNFAGREPVPALDVFSLTRTADRWRIISVVSDTQAHALDPNAEADILAVLDRALLAHAYNPAGDHDWATLDEVFVPSGLMGLRFFPGDPDTCVVGYREFMDHPRRSNALREGFEETDRTRTVEVVGDVAVVRERFTMRFAARSPVGAIDVFSLARVRGAWRIVSFISDVEEQRV